MDKSKLILPITIILASIILGGFFYASQTNKQKSIERQQEIKIEQEEKEQLKKQAKTEREVLEKCGKVAQQNYEVFQEEWNRTHKAKGYSHFSEMTIHFNEELNLCVYKGGIADDKRWEIHIFNAYTNEVLTSFVSFSEPNTWEEYTKNWYDRFNEKSAYYFEER